MTEKDRRQNYTWHTRLVTRNMTPGFVLHSSLSEELPRQQSILKFVK
jgi:hypothetical protein